MKVAVYGTLKQGNGNHRLLTGATLLGSDVLRNNWRMYHLGGFPGVKYVPDMGDIHVEVYEVDEATFERLDRLEGYNHAAPMHGLYDRMETMTSFGQAWIYIYNGYVHKDWLISDGNWER